MSKFETWRTNSATNRRYTGSTAAEAVAAAYTDSGIGTLDEFTDWITRRGIVPFTTGRTWIVSVPGASIPLEKLHNTPTPATGAPY